MYTLLAFGSRPGARPKWFLTNNNINKWFSMIRDRQTMETNYFQRFHDLCFSSEYYYNCAMLRYMYTINTYVYIYICTHFNIYIHIERGILLYSI